MSDNRITGQIAVHKTDKKLLEFIDGLNAAPLLITPRFTPELCALMK